MFIPLKSDMRLIGKMLLILSRNGNFFFFFLLAFGWKNCKSFYSYTTLKYHTIMLWSKKGIFLSRRQARDRLSGHRYIWIALSVKVELIFYFFLVE